MNCQKCGHESDRHICTTCALQKKLFGN